MSRWTTQELCNRLEAAFGAGQVEEIPTADGAIQVTLPDCGDLGITIALTDRQVFVSTPLVEAEQVADRAAFNDACMRLNPLNPLSNLGLTTINDRDTYIVFGELSPDSTAEQIELEVRTLADNAIDAIETLQPFLVKSAVSA
jgi:uncharacterized protein YjfI (DUF2170 family)